MTQEEIDACCKPYEPAIPHSPNKPRLPSGKADGVIFFGETFIPKRRADGYIEKLVSHESKENKALMYLRPMDTIERKRRGFALGTSVNKFLEAELLFDNRDIIDAAQEREVPIQSLFVTEPHCIIGHHPGLLQKWIVIQVEDGIWVCIYTGEKKSDKAEKAASGVKLPDIPIPIDGSKYTHTGLHSGQARAVEALKPAEAYEAGEASDNPVAASEIGVEGPK